MKDYAKQIIQAAAVCKSKVLFDQVAEIEEKYGVEVCYETPQQSQSPATPIDSPVVKKLSKAIKDVHGITARTIGIGGGTVGAELRREGIPCVVWSTMDELAHMPNEYCKIENIQKDAETLISLFAEKD